MGEAWRYWKQVRLDAADAIRREDVPEAIAFFRQQFPTLMDATDVPDHQVQSQLVQQMWMATNHRANAAALCLRCYVANATEQACQSLAQRFGHAHGFRSVDLLRLVLDDWQFSLRTIASLSSEYRSLSDKILQTFQPEQGSLSGWTKRLACSDAELHHFLMEHELYLISDWAALNAIRNTAHLQRILTDFFSLTATEVQHDCCLLESFHAVYRRDRREAARLQGQEASRQPVTQNGRSLQHRLRSRCEAPTLEQRQQMVEHLQTAGVSGYTPQTLISQLQLLANRVRQYRIATRLKKVPTTSIDEPSHANRILEQPTPESEDDEQQNDFLTIYRQEFLTGLDAALSQVIAERVTVYRRKKPPIDRPFLEALDRFHCQRQSMTEIAPHVGLTQQFQVVRLLKLKQLRADVRQRLLLRLRDRVLVLAQDYADPTRLKALDQRLEVALSEQVDQMLQEAEAESYTKQRPVSSLFTQRLCRHLYQLKQDHLKQDYRSVS